MSVRILTAGSVAALSSVAALALTACSSGSGGSGAYGGSGGQAAASSSSSSSSSAATTVSLAAASSSKGMILTMDGRALYTYSPDTATSSACTGGCASVWPPVTGIAHAGSGVSGTFGTIKRPDGSTQVTFDGHPVYEFSGDKAAGQVNGDGAQGGTWHVVTLSGAAASSSSASSSSGGGYTY